MEKLFEYLASKRSRRVYCFREARKKYEKLLRAKRWAIEEVTPQIHQLAQAELVLVEAESLFNEAIRLSQEDGIIRDVAIGQFWLGSLLHLQGRFAESSDLLNSSLGIFKILPQMGPAEWQTKSSCHYRLGLIALEQGFIQEAKKHFMHSLEIDTSISDMHGQLVCRRALNRCESAIKSSRE